MTLRTEPTAPTLVVGVDVRCLVDPYLRGFSRYTHELVHALSRRPGLRVIGFTDAELAHEIPVPVVHFSADREVVREQMVLPRLLRGHNIDVLLCPTNRGLPFLAPCPTVLTLHDAVEWDSHLVAQRSGKARMRFAYSSAFSLAGASLVLTVSRASADAIVRAVGVRPERLRVVHEAADARFSPHAEPGDGPVVQGLGIERDYVLYVGGFDKKKDVVTLIRAFGEMRGVTDADLILAGRITDDAASLVRLTTELDLVDRVRFVGYVADDDLPAFYRGARCFAFPAIAEGFGLPPVEAMACGVAVVAADAAALPEIVGDGGQLFAASDVSALAAALRELTTSESTRSHWSAAALRRAGEFSWDATAEQTERVLREAAAVGFGRMCWGRLSQIVRPRNWAS